MLGAHEHPRRSFLGGSWQWRSLSLLPSSLLFILLLCHGDRARPRPRKCLFLLLHHPPPSGMLGAGGHGGTGPAPHPSPCCQGPLPRVTQANHAVSPPCSIDSSEAQAGGMAGGSAGPGSQLVAPNPVFPPSQSSLALPNGERARTISEYLSSSKKRKVEEKDFGTDYVSPGLRGMGCPCPHGCVRSCPCSWHIPAGSWGGLGPFGSNRPLCCRAAMQTKVKTTWWWMRSVLGWGW